MTSSGGCDESRPGEPPLGPADTDADAQALFAKHVLPELETLYRVALSLTRRHADAEDLVQDTLLRSYRSIGTFDGRHPRAWLLTIMRNARVNRDRRSRPQLLGDPDATGALVAAEGAGSGNVEEIVMSRTLDAAVEQALAALPPKLRGVVELVDADGLSYAEAAEGLGIPVGTVMSRLHRARRRMRKRLAATGVLPKRPMMG